MAVRDFWNIAGRTGRAAQEIEGTRFPSYGDDWNWPRYLGPYLSRSIEPCESVILLRKPETSVSTYKEWSTKWKEQWSTGSFKFTNPWPIICSISVVKVREMLGAEASDHFRSLMVNKLTEQLVPELWPYNWKSDRWYWQNIYSNALRQVFIDEKELSGPVNVDATLKEQFRT